MLTTTSTFLCLFHENGVALIAGPTNATARSLVSPTGRRREYGLVLASFRIKFIVMAGGHLVGLMRFTGTASAARMLAIGTYFLASKVGLASVAFAMDTLTNRLPNKILSTLLAGDRNAIHIVAFSLLVARCCCFGAHFGLALVL